MQDDAKNFFSHAFKDKWMIWVLRVVVTVIGLAIAINVVYYFIDRSNNKHAKMLFGLAEYFPEEKKDTVYSSLPVKHDTVFVKPPENKTIPEKRKALGTEKKDTSGHSKYDIKSTFNAPSQIGDNNTQNNVTPTPREVTQEVIDNIQKYIPDKLTPVALVRRSQDAETYKYSMKIMAAMQKIGYTNVVIGGILNEVILGGDPEVNLKRQTQVVFEKQPGGGQMNIIVPSNQ